MTRTRTHNETNSGTACAAVDGECPPNAHDTGPRIKEALLGVAADLPAVFPTSKIFVMNGNFADRNTFTREHTLIHDRVTCEEEQVRRKHGLRRINKIDHVSGDQIC